MLLVIGGISPVLPNAIRWRSEDCGALELPSTFNMGPVRRVPPPTPVAVFWLMTLRLKFTVPLTKMAMPLHRVPDVV